MSGQINTVLLAQGNFGAVSVIEKIQKCSDSKEILTKIQSSHHLRGSEIWGLYKDVCKEDIDTFVRKLNEM